LPASARQYAQKWFDNNLAQGYNLSMGTATEAAKELAKRSVAARRLKWGNDGFRKKMQAWGKLGGRPRKNVRKS
jgi:hypothetical protein